MLPGAQALKRCLLVCVYAWSGDCCTQRVLGIYLVLCESIVGCLHGLAELKQGVSIQEQHGHHLLRLIPQHKQST